jgi:4-amino-4-deoxy-L-arabinose transferase-like glycosyltransferase
MLIKEKVKQFKFSKENILVILLFFVIVFISFCRLEYSPATWYDEGINSGVAKSFASDGVFSLKVAPNEFVENRQFLITTNYPVLLPVALSLKIFGVNFFAARLPMALYILLFSFVVYLFVKKKYGFKPALLSLALLAVFLPFYGNGKSVLGEVPGLLFLLCALFFVNSKNLYKLFLSGLFFGLSVATKPFFILVLGALFLGEIYNIFKSGLRKPVEYAILVLGIFIPMFFWVWTINPSLSVNKLGSTFSYYSNSYADDTNISELMFSNIKRFVSETTPIHFFVMLVVSFLMIFRDTRKKEAITSEIVLLSFIFLNFLWYLKTPGWYRYFFPAHILLFLFFPISLMRVFSRRFAILVVVLFICAQSYMLVSKRNEPLYFSTEVQDTANYIEKEIPVDSSLLVVNGPSVSFLMDSEHSQYVRINPELIFAPNNIKEDVNSIDSDYIISGSLTEHDLEIKNIIDLRYNEVKRIGHYGVFKRSELKD